MKKRKLIYLFPLAALLLSGCSFAEFKKSVGDSWIGQHILHPIYDPIKNLINGGGKEEQKSSDEDDQKGDDHHDDPAEVKYGTLEAPLSAAEFITNIDKLIDYSTVEKGSTVTHETEPFFLKAKVRSNEAINDGKIRFTNLFDESDSNSQVTGYFLQFADGVDSDTYGVQNAMAGAEIVVKGYGKLFHNNSDVKVYEIGEQSKEGEKGVILSVTPPAPTPGTDYGTFDDPLTATEAHALLDSENPSKAEMYVGGVIKSNTKWSTQYGNVDIVISDGENDFTIFRTATFPLGFDKTAITENSLKDLHVIAKGTGKIYEKDETKTYELDQGCTVEYLEGVVAKTITEIVEVSVPENVVKGGSLTTSQVSVTVKYDDNSTDSAVIKSISLETGVAATGVQGTITIEGWDQPIPFTIDVIESTNSMAAPYAAALAVGSGETAQFTFDGVIVAQRGDNEWFIQNGEYGIEYYAANEEFAVNKHVQVVSTLQNYKGLPETKTIESATVLGDGEMPNPVAIDSKAALDSTNFGLLATVTGVAKEDWSAYSGSANKTLILQASDGDIPVYLKSGFFNTLESTIKSVKAGDTVTFGNVVTSVFTNRQIVACKGLTIEIEAAPAKEIESIGVVAGPTEAVPVLYEFKNSDVSVTVNYKGGGSGQGVVTSVSADTSVAGEDLTGTVTIEGWEAEIEFTYSVTDNTPPVESVVYNKVTAAQSDWSGTYILVNDESAVAWTGVDTSGCSSAVTISSNSISDPASSVVKLQIATQGSGYSIKVVGGDKDGKYLDGKLSSGKEANGIYFSDSAVELSISFEIDWVKITAPKGQVMRYNNAATNGNWFRFYKSTTYEAQQPVQLYKLAQ